MRLAIAVALSAFVALAPAPLRPQAADTLSLERRLEVVRRMDAHVREHFAHWAGMDGRSYDSLVTAFRARATEAATRRDFDFAAMAFTAGLANGHSQFSDAWLWRTQGSPLRLRLAHGVDGWVVTASEYPGLVRGDVVRTLDGQPIEAAYGAARPYLAEGGERARRNAWSFRSVLFPSSFVLGLASGDTVRIHRDAATDSALRARRAPLVPTPWRWLDSSGIGYVRIRQFSPNSHEDSALAIIAREFRDAPALVVDVRGNGGGNTPSRLIRRLMGDSSWRSMRIERSTIAFDGLFGNRTAEGDRNGYRGRLVILADHGCGSACEDFVAPFRLNGRATVVGDTTWGSTGQPRQLDLGDGLSFQVSARRYQMPDGTRFEGVGVPPHVVVPLRAPALRAGRDEALERAVALLREP